MKKAIAVALIMCVVFFLCGCSATEVISANQQEYIVSALGFDSEKGKVKLTVEAVAVNTEALREEEENFKISALGNTVYEAYSNALARVTQPLSLGHSGVSVIGSEINADRLEEILNFHKEQTQINISAMLVFTESAEELLNCRPTTSVAIGYDIMSMLEVAEKWQGTEFKNRLYEVNSQKLKPLKTFAIPRISVKEEKPALSGLAVFKDNKMNTLLDNEETALYCLITNSLTEGEIVLKGDKTEIKYANVKYDFGFEERLNVNVGIHLKANGNVENLKELTEEFLYKEDIFGIGNIIYQKDNKIWERIKTDYQDFYRNADIKVNIYG